MNFEPNQPLFLAVVEINYLSAIASLAISISVGCIAFLQFRLAREKFRLDLYDKRFRIYQAVLEFIANAASGKVGQNEVVNFDVAKREAFFLFSECQEILNYFDTLRQQAEAYHILKSQADAIQGPPNPQRSTLVKQMLENHDWFLKQTEITRAKFAPFLSF